MLCLILAWSLQSELESLLKNHEASREMIRSLECRYQSHQQNTPFETAIFRCRGNTVLVDLEFNNDRLINQYKEGVVTTFYPKRQTWNNVERRVHEAHSPMMGYVWHMALFDINLGNGKAMPLAELCRKAGRVKIHRHDKGTDLDFSHVGSDFKITLSPSHNYIATRVERYTAKDVFQNKTIKYVLKVEDMIEQDSIYFPSRTFAQWEQDGLKMPDIQYTLSDIKINQPMDQIKLSIQFPEGSCLSDFIEGKVYYIDAAGNKLREHEKYRIGRAFLRDTRPVQPVAFHEVQKEPTSYLMYLFWICGGLVVVGLVWEIRRRVKLAR